MIHDGYNDYALTVCIELQPPSMAKHLWHVLTQKLNLSTLGLLEVVDLRSLDNGYMYRQFTPQCCNTSILA